VKGQIFRVRNRLAEIKALWERLGLLLCDEDLTDDKLREASEGLLSNLFDRPKPLFEG